MEANRRLGLAIRGAEKVEQQTAMEVADEDQQVSHGGEVRGRKRGVDDLYSDGGEEDENGKDKRDDETLGTLDSSSTLSPAPPTLGSLHQRRVNASPEKFNKARFELQPPKKKARIENKLDVTYDETGTPRIVSAPLQRQSLFSGSCFGARPQTAQPQPNNTASTTTGTRSVSSTSTRSVSSSELTPLLINSSRLSSFPHAKSFSLLHGISKDNDLLLLLVSYLNLPSLISLYAISKGFHYLFNRHPTAFILSSMRTWAPNADTIFPWRCYQSLCIKDPAKRQKKRLRGREAVVRKKWDDLRDVPSLKWLQMVVWREGVSKDCLIQLATHGLRCPPGTHDALKRMWFLLDLPLNAHRIALIRTNAYSSDKALHNLTCFFVKVDMLFTDPVAPAYHTNHPNQKRFPNKFAGGSPSGVSLRKMLLAERQLTPLWRVLRGWNWDPSQPRGVPMTRLDVLRLWVRHRYRYPQGASQRLRSMSIMGIPWYEVGAVGWERTGVSFHNLAPAKSEGDAGDATKDSEGEANIHIALTHPLIIGSALDNHQATQLLRQNELLYPHRKRIILAHEKPREPLLRPDELVLKESVRRRLGMHKKWVTMMLYGVCDEGGRMLPVWTEEEMLRMQKGLPPRPKGKKVQREGASGGEGHSDVGDGGVNGKAKGKEKADELKTPASAQWSVLPPKVLG